MARVAVVGPGSIGVFFAGHLAAAGHEVLACARRPFDRYRIDSSTLPLDIEAHVLTDPAQIQQPVEWVLVCVKAHQTVEASPWLAALCDESTKVIVLQNGIEHDRVEPYVNGAAVIPAVVVCAAELLEPGHIVHTLAGHLIVPDVPHGEAMLELFAKSAAEVRPSANFVTHQWRKLSMNVMANAITALTGRTFSVLGEPDIRPIAIDLVRESWEVAARDGADLDPADAENIIDAVVKSGRDSGTSMLYDTLAGRPTEHDAIHGAALRRAAKHGIDTPTIRIVHALLDARSPANATAPNASS